MTQSSFEGAWTAAYTQRGEFGLIETWNDYEKIPVAFSLPNGVIVPAGDYDWQVFHGHFETATDRFISGIFDVQCCGFYGGHLLQTQTTIALHPGDTVTFSGEHTMQLIGLPTGHVAIHIGSIDAALNFTPDMQIRMQAQYDNISKDLGYSVALSLGIRSGFGISCRRWRRCDREHAWSVPITPDASVGAHRASVPGLIRQTPRQRRRAAT